jgi:UDP-glucuronate 4-epimerase
MRYLITGAAGFIGSHLAEELAKSGHEVRAIDSFSDFLYSSQLKHTYIESFERLSIQFFKRNLIEDNLHDLLEGVDVVINQAALPGLVKSWKFLDRYLEANVVGLKNLLDSCVGSSVKRFIQISTSSVYGKSAVGDESSLLLPYSPYGVSKLAAEQLVSAYEQNFGLNAVRLRYFSVYGPRQRPDMAFHKFIHAIDKGLEFTIYGDGTQSRSNTFVRDIVDGTISASDLTRKIDGGVFNLSGPERIDLMEAISLIEVAIGKQARYRFESNRPGDQYETFGNSSLATKILEYQPRIKFVEGIKRQVEWQLESNCCL